MLFWGNLHYIRLGPNIGILLPLVLAAFSFIYKKKKRQQVQEAKFPEASELTKLE